MASLPHEDGTLSGSPEAPADERRSTLSLLRNVVVDLTQVVEDSTELIGASIREELAQFRQDTARHVLSLVATVIGGSLLTAGLSMLISSWIGNWPGTLLILGAIYLAAAFVLRVRNPSDGDEGWK
jgi:hypothetical protein